MCDCLNIENIVGNMSIEEKAKAYDEALEKAKMHVNSKGIGDTVDLCKNLFPELRESEDEKVRKEIINYLNFAESHNLLRAADYEKKKGWLTYLEKQKYDRMKPIYDARESFESALEKAWNDYHNGYENVDKLEDDYVECAHAKGFREGYLFGLEKQKEHSMSAEEVLTRAGLKPYKDGNQWCILAGDNIQEGICGFGDTIDEALYQFLMEILEIQKERKLILKFKVGDKIHLIDGTSPNYEDDCITIREIDTVNYIGEFKKGYVPIKEQNKWELVKNKESLRDFINNFPYSDQKEQKPIEDVVKDITKNKESATKFLKSAGIMTDDGELHPRYK